MVFLGALVVGSPLLAAKKPGQPLPITPEVAERLQYMREEEKLAHDVYLYLNGIYSADTNTFANITLSEQQHTDAVKDLLVKYKLSDPALGKAPGEFENDELQALYDSLVDKGEIGLVDALTVGVTIERKDMTDIVEAIEVSANYKDIVNVYSNLLAGSENHLAAFLKALDSAQTE
jgi:hypothetical protein